MTIQIQSQTQNPSIISDRWIKPICSPKLILDTQFETFFNSITTLTSKICNVPVAMINFVNEDTIWSQSQLGFPFKKLHNRKRFCGVFPDDSNYFEVSNTDLDEIPLGSHLPISDNQAKFYAGAKIKLPLGEIIGVLCVFDTAPYSLTELQKDYLVGMAHVIEKALVTKNSLSRTVN